MALLSSTAWTLLHSTVDLLISTEHYYTLPCHYLAPLDSTAHCLGVPGSTTLYHHSTYSSIGLSNILPWFYLVLVDSTKICHGSTLFYLTLQYSTMALYLVISTGHNYILLCMGLHSSTVLYTALYHGSH